MKKNETSAVQTQITVASLHELLLASIRNLFIVILFFCVVYFALILYVVLKIIGVALICKFICFIYCFLCRFQIIMAP